ncbi:MAG TPA: flagellar motor switch protein, partial [Arenibaculum sp.]|nr:flagellar motor switch protein [Arenibaculum sp.]
DQTGIETASAPAVRIDMTDAAPLAACEDPMLLAAVAEQKDELTMRGRRLADAEAVLAATEARVGAQVSRLSEIKSEIESLMTQRSALQQEDIRRMVAIYEAMKPKDAARIFNDLETDIIIDVLDRMPERRSAPIIADLADEKAREVTRTILQRRNLPGDRPATAPSYPRAAQAVVP